MDTKPGYKTSEFWLSLTAMVIGTLLASGAFGETEIPYKILAFAASVLASLGYSYSRARVKASEQAATAAKALQAVKAATSDPQ